MLMDASVGPRVKPEEDGGWGERLRFLFSFNNDFPEGTATVRNLDFDGFALISGFRLAANCNRSSHEASVSHAFSVSRYNWLKGICGLSRRFPCHLETTSPHHKIPKEVLNERPTVRSNATATCNGKRKRHSANKAKFHCPHPIDQPRRALRAED
ncbi:hypothetical protein [Rhizobium sp. WYCCWR 11146]|uniref:hypothetical protein n=1 Tax=Rhizobium sp. WYCCWR 11146 TaxID=2749833 RepID=UPI0015E62E3F|nr:hypothetical protein [Rhizobium sp. WYCCWR 11146]MBA1349580.1 hypothetical protein [Rhizobium sp. WYCCWR 11146]